MDITTVILVLFGLVVGFPSLTTAAPPLTTTTDTMYCHVCVDADSDQDCNTTQLCSQGSGCLTSLWHDGGDTVIQKRCTTKEICSRMELHNDKMCYDKSVVFNGMCSFCCLTPGCNKDIPQHATPRPTTHQESNHHPPPSRMELSVDQKGDQQEDNPPCHHHKDSNKVVTVDRGDHGTDQIHGLKISINVEIPNQAYPCGCQDKTRPTQQTVTTTPTPTTASTIPTTTRSTTTTTTPTATPTTATTTTTTTPTTTIPTKAVTIKTTTSKEPEAVATSTVPSTKTTTTKPPPPPTTTTATTTTTTTTPSPETTTATPTTPKREPTTTKIQTTLDPDGPKCYTCTDPTCQTQTLTTCPSTHPYCMNTLTQNIKGIKTVFKSCMSETVCRKDWYTDTSNLADCFLLTNEPVGSPGLKLEKCSFCCLGDGCNHDAMIGFDKLWFP